MDGECEGKRSMHGVLVVIPSELYTATPEGMRPGQRSKDNQGEN